MFGTFVKIKYFTITSQSNGRGGRERDPREGPIGRELLDREELEGQDGQELLDREGLEGQDEGEGGEPQWHQGASIG